MIEAILSMIDTARRSGDKGLLVAAWQLFNSDKVTNEERFKIFRALSLKLEIGAVVQWSLLASNMNHPVFYEDSSLMNINHIERGLIIPVDKDTRDMTEFGYELVVSLKPSVPMDYMLVSAMLGGRRNEGLDEKNQQLMLSPLRTYNDNGENKSPDKAQDFRQSILDTQGTFASRIIPGNQFYVHKHVLACATRRDVWISATKISPESVGESMQSYVNRMVFKTTKNGCEPMYDEIRDCFEPMLSAPSRMEEHYAHFGEKPTFIYRADPDPDSNARYNKPLYFGKPSQPDNLDRIEKSLKSDTPISRVMGLNCPELGCILPFDVAGIGLNI